MKKSRIFIAIVIILSLILAQATPVYAASTSIKAPTLNSVAYDEGNNCVVLHWSKVSKIDGYQIYRAESKDGKYKKIATVKSTKTTYKDTKFEYDNTYYYKIRAYKKVDGKNKYSKYSSKKNVKVWAKTMVLDFDMLMKEATEKHSAEQLNPTSFDGFEDFLVEGSEYKRLLTNDEIKALQNIGRMQPKEVTYDEAVSDVELLFRTLKYSYGAYFYFGSEERFDKAEKEVMKKLEGKTTVRTNDLKKYLQKSLSFVRDGHFGVEGSAINDESVRFEYLYTDIYFSKDNKGFYKKIEQKKWYYQSCTNKDMRIEPTLTANGEVMYSPVLFCPVTETDFSDSITLKCGSEKMNMTVKWREQEALKQASRTQDFVFTEHEGISYISIRCFDNELDQSVFRAYENTGKEIRDSKLVIYDIRANGGGGSQYSKTWTTNFAGKEPALNEAFSSRRSALVRGYEYAAPGSEMYTVFKSGGNVLENDTPVILLVDDMCGSSGESALSYAKAMENVIVIGSNSAGYQLCGNVSEYQLPESGIYVNIPVSLQFQYNMDNVDGKGYEPDIWCNPKNALEATYNLIVKAGFADQKTVDKLAEKVEEATPATITLKWDNHIIPEGDGFGTRNFNDTVTVYNNGKNITDYKVIFEDPSCGTATKNADGTLQLKAKKQGQWTMYIEYKGVKHKFGWATY